MRELLSDSRVNPADRDNICIKTASQNGHVRIVEMLLQSCHVDAIADNHIALRYACLAGHAEVAKLLLDNHRGLPLRLGDLTASVCRRGHIEVYKVLLEHRDRLLPQDA